MTPPDHAEQIDTLRPSALPLPAEVDVAIVGSGFSGLAMAVALKRSGREDFLVLERARASAAPGATTPIPGCACDVPCHLYSFSFAPNPDWSRSFSRQPEICAYLRRVAERSNGCCRTCASAASSTEAAWDEDGQRWRIETSERPR